MHRNPGKRSSAGKHRSGLRTNRPHTFHSHQCSGHFRVLSSADVSTPLRGKRCRRGRARTSCTEISQPACHRQHGITVEAIRLLLHAVYRRIVPERSLVRAPRIELFQCQLFPTIDSAGPGKAQRGLRPLGLFESLLDRRQLAQPVVKAVSTRGVSHVVRRASDWVHWERTHLQHCTVEHHNTNRLAAAFWRLSLLLYSPATGSRVHLTSASARGTSTGTAVAVPRLPRGHKNRLGIKRGGQGGKDDKIGQSDSDASTGSGALTSVRCTGRQSRCRCTAVPLTWPRACCRRSPARLL